MAYCPRIELHSYDETLANFAYLRHKICNKTNNEAKLGWQVQKSTSFLDFASCLIVTWLWRITLIFFVATSTSFHGAVVKEIYFTLPFKLYFQGIPNVITQSFYFYLKIFLFVFVTMSTSLSKGDKSILVGSVKKIVCMQTMPALLVW